MIRFRSGDRDLRFQLQEVFFADPTHVHQLLDIILEDDRLNVYAGELEVRPPAAPTTKRGSHEREPDDLSQSFS